jgi:large subunit ribosomal protein L4
MKSKVIGLDNKAAGDIELADEVFGTEVRRDLLARMVNYQLAKRRSGTHKTKGMNEVQGSTAKPWRQKGSGRARAGSVRAPHWRGGGVVFGPVVRSHAHKLPKKVRSLALKSALSSKQAEGKLIILKEATLSDAKTKALKEMFQTLGLSNALIVAGNEVDGNFERAARNIPNIDVLPSAGANVYDILRRDVLVLTTEAVEALEARLK